MVGMQAALMRSKKVFSGHETADRAGAGPAASSKLLILDEPTNGLDPAGIRELRDI
jgi:ABC-2 type transport system ATP-binding protein